MCILGVPVVETLQCTTVLALSTSDQRRYPAQQGERARVASVGGGQTSPSTSHPQPTQQLHALSTRLRPLGVARRSPSSSVDPREWWIKCFPLPKRGAGAPQALQTTESNPVVPVPRCLPVGHHWWTFMFIMRHFTFEVMQCSDPVPCLERDNWQWYYVYHCDWCPGVNVNLARPWQQVKEEIK